MKQNIRSYLDDSRKKEVDTLMNEIIENLKSEGFSVEFGRIGLRTNYALVYNKDHETEYVGYTFLKDIKYYKENVGQLKALQQAVTRKKIAEEASQE